VSERDAFEGAQMVRRMESERFGSRAYARALLAERGALAQSDRQRRIGKESDRHRRVEAVEREAKGLQSRLLDLRRRLLPFELLLQSGGSSEVIFQPGPYSETRCYERVVAGRHDVEYFSFLVPHDRDSEGYQPFGALRLQSATPLADLELCGELRKRLAREGVHTLPSPRISGTRGGGLLRVLPDMGETFAAPGQPILSLTQVTRLLLEAATGIQRVKWFESAFTEVPAVPVHRYYLDTDLHLYLVRHEGMEKRFTILEPSKAAASRGLLIHARRKRLER
jgi:hypothetical protein